MLTAMIKVIRTRGLKWKWLWCVMAFFGVFAFRMNWNTGELEYQFLAIQFVGAGATRALGSFSPWILTATAPLGAILILTGVWANPPPIKGASKTAVETFG